MVGYFGKGLGIEKQYSETGLLRFKVVKYLSSIFTTLLCSFDGHRVRYALIKRYFLALSLL
jgi:hypothetical protein